MAAADFAYIRFEGWHLDTNGRQMLSPDGVIVSLGSSDTWYYAHCSSIPTSPEPEVLIEHVYGKDSHAMDRSIDVCISHLWHHLKLDLRNPSIIRIRTVRNAGYMLASQVKHKK